jgi:hypothetical protein
MSVAMPGAEEIQSQQELLATYRRTLAVYLKQRALQGAAFAPPAVENGIRETRDQIRRLKEVLRSWNVPVEDAPDDEEHADALGGTAPVGVGRLAKLFAAVGMLLVFAGFGLFAYVVLVFIMYTFEVFGANSPPHPADVVPFHLLPVGAGMLLAGIFLFGVGAFMGGWRGRGRRG